MESWGIWPRQQLLQGGKTLSELNAAVGAGQLVRAGSRYLARPDVDPLFLRAATLGARLTCATAAKLYGVPVVRDRLTHVWYGRSTTLDMDTVFVQAKHSHRHRAALPTAPILSPLDVVVHALKCLPEREALIVAEGTVTRGLLEVQDLERALSNPRDQHLLPLVALIDTKSQSLIETAARLLLIQAGYRVEAQFAIKGLGHVDLLVEGRIVVELDGYEYHWNKVEFAEDRRRNNIAAAQGYRVLRFTFDDVMWNPQRVLNLVEMTLRASA